MRDLSDRRDVSGLARGEDVDRVLVFVGDIDVAVRVDGRTLIEACALPVGELAAWFDAQTGTLEKGLQPIEKAIATELLKEIRVPDLMAEETLNRTRMGVTRASRQEQIPWISSSLAEDFSFVPGAGGSAGRSGPGVGRGRDRGV